MKELSIKQFMYSQPGPRDVNATDRIYLDLCNNLLKLWEQSGLLADTSDELRQAAVLGIIGYYQDVLCDTGLWRSFTDECLRKYGRRVPFHSATEEYIVYELNRSDIEFVLWYQLAFNSMQYRFRYPLDPELVELAGIFFTALESGYDDMVNPEDYREFFDVELNNPEYAEKLYNFIHWLYWRSWLIFPPFQLSFSQIYPEMMELRNAAKDEEDAKKKIEQFQHQVMATMPTGPLAYTLREWLALIVEGRHPKEKVRKFVAPEGSGDEGLTEHPFYTSFIKANSGSPIRFIESYKELNRFFIEGMGWEEGQDHLSAMKGHGNFVLMATPHSGLMVAKNIAKCVKHPDNALYDEEYARKYAFNLISQRAVCPGDMLRYICENGWLPDMTFPEYPTLRGSHDMPSEEARRKAAVENWDFLSRAYLQEYYRGD